MKLKMSISNRKLLVTIGIWLVLFVMFFNMTNFFQPVAYALISAAFNTFTIAFVYYFTVGYLFPRHYGKGSKYFVVSLIIIVLLAFTFWGIDTYLIPEIRNPIHERPPVIFHMFKFIISLGFTFFVGTSMSLIDKTNIMRETEKVLKEEKLETELKLLKAQINPHFIFNALNNIYSLTYMQSKNAPDSVLKLSEMLRYVFYDCNKDKVTIDAEIKYIKNYNAFQQMKSGFSQNINLKVDLKPGNIEIAPMLFIPFLENAFKYSRIEENEDAYVTISISSNENGKVHLHIENSVPQTIKSNPGSGMGIANVKHRLLIIYPDKHKLHIENLENKYIVDLKLET